MQPKRFLLLLVPLAILVALTSPPILHPFFQAEPTPTRLVRTPPSSPTPTMTPDPFAGIPTVTPRSNGVVIEVYVLPSPALGEFPPTLTPTPLAAVPLATATGLPDPMVTISPVSDEALPHLLPAPSEGPATIPPDRLRIPRLRLDVPVVPVSMAPVLQAGSGTGLAVPPGKAAGWLNTSAAFDRPGNTVLTGRHQAKGLTVFYELWTLEPGDEIILSAGEQSRHYLVEEVISQSVPEQQKPSDEGSNNAEYIQPSEDERLTLVTDGPEQDNSPWTVVRAILNEE